MKKRFAFAVVRLALRAAVVCAVGCSCGVKAQTSAIQQPQFPAPTPFDAGKLAEIDAAINLAIADGRCPGGVFWMAHRGVAYHKAFGARVVEPGREEMTEDTLFDAASLTKVVATTPAVMKLVEQGNIILDAPVCRYLEEFRGDGKEEILVRHLMTHTSGLPAGLPLSRGWQGAPAAISLACAVPLTDLPGKSFRYSDINFILLAEIVHRVSGQAFAVYCAEQIFRPLGMRETGFCPSESLRSRIAPTERVDGEILRGVVHDPTARRMGGVAGHAGLFTTAADLARYARMMLNRGELDGVRVFRPETVSQMTTVQAGDEIAARRGLGWDIDSPYAGPRGAWFPVGSYGHTGWTGGSVWIDPFSDTFVLFLSNRNHPTAAGNVISLRRTLGTLVAEAVRDFNFAYVPGALPWSPQGASLPQDRRLPLPARVLAGIDVLERDRFQPLQGLRVGLITNQTGIDRERRSTIDLLHNANGVRLAALFSPEHGIRGVQDERVEDSRDEKTGLPVYSLYGKNRAPTPEQLQGIDALVFDIQDIGCRFYTYISTLGECLTAAARERKPFFVLDRPNPIGGVHLEGPMLEAPQSFTAWHDLPLRHGMTVGELARMFNAERNLNADLRVIACEGWKRGMWSDETGLPWVNPSPNMRSLTAASLYPGVGLLEFCNVSVGRGTDRPFETVGAPYIDDRALAASLNAAGLDGVRFVPVRFTPTSSIFANKECGGVQIIVIDRDATDAVDVGIQLALTLQRLFPADFKIDGMSRLLGDPAASQGIANGERLSQIKSHWTGRREEFCTRRGRFLIYPEN